MEDSFTLKVGRRRKVQGFTKVLDLNSDKAQSFYYSAHHLARDLFWNAGAFSFFVILGATLDEKFRTNLWKAVSSFAALNSATLQIGISLACLALGAISGIIANYTFVALRPFPARSRLGKLTYDGWYERDKDRLKELYDKVFSETGKFLLPPTDYRQMDLVVRLTSFMRLYNPSGYAHVFRTYSIVSLFRQAIVYSTLLGIWSVFAENWASAIVLFLSLPVLEVCVFYSIRHSITREYAFIVATFQWMKQRLALVEKGIEATANPGPQADT